MKHLTPEELSAGRDALARAADAKVTAELAKQRLAGILEKRALAQDQQPKVPLVESKGDWLPKRPATCDPVEHARYNEVLRHGELPDRPLTGYRIPADLTREEVRQGAERWAIENGWLRPEQQQPPGQPELTEQDWEDLGLPGRGDTLTPLDELLRSVRRVADDLSYQGARSQRLGNQLLMALARFEAGQ